MLIDHDYSRRSSDNATSTRSESLQKTGSYQLLQGRFTQDEVNAQARAYRSPLLEAPWRHFDDASVKYGYRDTDVDAMYRYTQENSRLLAGQGSSLVRTDIERIRRGVGESTWSEAAQRNKASR